MAQDIGFDRATGGPSVTLLAGNVSDGAISDVTSSIDFGAIQPLKCGFELKLDCQASAAELATLVVVWSHDNTDFGIYSASQRNGWSIPVDCVASAVVVHVGEFPIQARYAKFYLDNESGGSINAASTALVLTDGFGDIA